MGAVSDVAAKRIGSEVAGKYRLESLIGEGGMGSVFRARHRWTEAVVAVKLLARSNATSASAIERFVREARAAARIEHPHVVRVLDMGEDSDGTLYLVQELLDGPDLQTYLAEHLLLSPRECARILVPVLRGLQCVHDAGVIHRDIKPANIVLARGTDGERVPKLIDFGVARLTEPGDATSTRSGHALGTPAYMSPEQARGSRDVDARTDVWSSGVVLFEMLAGRRPFDGGNAQAAIAAILTEDPVALDAVCEGLPRDVVDVVTKALQHDRERRHASATTFADAIERCAGFSSEGIAKPVEPPRSTETTTLTASNASHASVRDDVPAVTATREPSTPAPAISNAKRRRLASIIVATLIPLAVVAGAAWFRNREPQRATSSTTPSVPTREASTNVTTVIADAALPIALAAPSEPPPATPRVDPPATVAPVAADTRRTDVRIRRPNTANAASTANAGTTSATTPRPTHGFNGAPLLDPLSQD